MQSEPPCVSMRVDASIPLTESPCFQNFLTKSNVGRSPRTAADALVGFRWSTLARPDQGVRPTFIAIGTSETAH